MTRPLTWNDLRAIRELQTQGIALDFECAQLWPHTALHAALARHLPLTEIGADTTILYQNDYPRSPLGFIQARRRRNRPEADLSFISPALDARPDAITIWYRLLAEATNAVGERGCQRIYAQVASDNGAEEVFRQSGFNVYTHQDIYILSAEQIKTSSPNSRERILRRQRQRDAWNLLRLYNAVTPRPVQQAEGMVSGEDKFGELSDWWEQTSGNGYVLEAHTNHTLAGAVRITRGRAANWLRLYLHPESPNAAEELVRCAVELTRNTHLCPVYCAVREYESGVRGQLAAAGFEFLSQHTLLVKYTTVRVKESALWPVPALDQPAPVARTSTHASEPGT